VPSAGVPGTFSPPAVGAIDSSDPAAGSGEAWPSVGWSVVTTTLGTGPTPDHSSSPAAAASDAAPAPVGDSEWWRTAVTYQIYLRSFADSDGDGIGDIPGIAGKLGYLADLGVDALWVNPWYPSPQADGGYDVADYRDIDPTFGTLDDARALIVAAHQAGLRILLDIVPNHTSDEHPWFTAALAAGPGSPERARYLFRPGRGPAGELPPNDWRAVFGGSTWQRTTITTIPCRRPG